MSKIDCCKVRFLGVALLACCAGTAIAETPANPEIQNPVEAAEKQISVGAASKENPVEAVANENPDVPKENENSEEADSVPEMAGYEMLEDFEITALKKIVSSDGTKLTYNADEDPASAGKTVLDLLKNVPMVTVDANDNISINGRDGVKFYVNGKEEPMLNSNASQILKSMPGSAVSKIEVIHEPGAKYDAEGNAGIINLITERQQKTDGYNGSLSAYLNNQVAGGSAFGMFKHKKVSASANINYTTSSFMTQNGTSDSRSFYTDSGNTLISNARQKTGFDYLGAGVSLSYEPTESNLFTLSANVFNMKATLKDVFSADKLINSAGATLWETDKTMGGRIKYMNVSANAGYQHTFSQNPQHNLILSYQYNFGRNPININHQIVDAINVEQSFSRQEQFSHNYIRENTAQMDYSLPLANNKHIIGIGAKTIFRDNSSNSGNTYLDDLNQVTANDYQEIGQFQDIYAGYLTYGATFAQKVSVNAGVRYEHTRMGMNFHGYPEKDFTNHLNDVVPNAGVTYIFDPATNLRLAYQMRISRPDLQRVNPFMIETTSNNFQAGNPDLKSEHSNLVSLTFTKFGRMLGGNVGLEFFDSENLIQSYLFVDGINRINSFANIGSKRSGAITGFLNYQINQQMSVNLNGRVEYGALKAPAMNARHYGWSGNLFGGWTWSPEKIARFSLYGGYNSRSLNIQGWHSGFYYYSLSVSRSFLADKSLTLTLSANNFLQDRTTYKNTTKTPDIISTETYTQNSWNVGVSLSWNFGNYQGKVKQLSTSIENDDKSSVSNKGQGGF